MMEIEENTIRMIHKAATVEFPIKGQYFYVSHKGADESYEDDVFKCTGSDKILVVGTSPTERSFMDNPARFPRKQWNFSPVSEEILNALGICIAKENVFDAEIIDDKNNEPHG